MPASDRWYLVYMTETVAGLIRAANICLQHSIRPVRFFYLKRYIIGILHKEFQNTIRHDPVAFDKSFPNSAAGNLRQLFVCQLCELLIQIFNLFFQGVQFFLGFYDKYLLFNYFCCSSDSLPAAAGYWLRAADRVFQGRILCMEKPLQEFPLFPVYQTTVYHGAEPPSQWLEDFRCQFIIKQGTHAWINGNSRRGSIRASPYFPVFQPALYPP